MDIILFTRLSAQHFGVAGANFRIPSCLATSSFWSRVFRPTSIPEDVPLHRFMSEFGIDLIRDACNLQPAIDTDQVPLCLACKDTPLQIGDDTVNHRVGRHDRLHTIVDLGVGHRE
jgi:hypothetical protein